MVLEFEFDQYQRYKLVHEAIESLRDKPRLKILDVGGYPGPILDFLPSDDILVIDQIEDVREHYQKANALELPFEDGSFDFVVSVDVYEHIVANQRDLFLQELSRVAHRAIFLMAPFHSDNVVSSEKLLDQHYKDFIKIQNQALTEHLENGLPDKDQTINYFREKGFAVASFPNGYLERWLPMMKLQGSLTATQEGKALLRQICSFYNKHMYKYDNCEPCYRYLLVVVKSDELTKSLPLLQEKISTSCIQDDKSSDTMKLYNLELLEIITKQGKVIQQKHQELEAKHRQVDELQHRVNELEAFALRMKNTLLYKSYKSFMRFIKGANSK